MPKSKVPITATHRLKQDYVRLKKDPVPYITAEPLPSNILEWHYVVSWLVFSVLKKNNENLINWFSTK